jgi:nucleotidyltransferase substrate binding protein (TIGR01987 family)
MVNKLRWKQRYQNYEKAYARLSEGILLDNYDSLQEAGLIQTFEFTFELGWKTLKDYLELLGFDAVSPRDVIKQAFQAGYISDGHLWLDALDKRNLMAHLYDEHIAQEVLNSIKTKYYALLQELNSFLLSKIND